MCLCIYIEKMGRHNHKCGYLWKIKIRVVFTAFSYLFFIFFNSHYFHNSNFSTWSFFPEVGKSSIPPHCRRVLTSEPSPPVNQVRPSYSSGEGEVLMFHVLFYTSVSVSIIYIVYHYPPRESPLETQNFFWLGTSSYIHKTYFFRTSASICYGARLSGVTIS